MDGKQYCPKCGYDYCICDVKQHPIETGDWFYSEKQLALHMMKKISKQLTEIKQTLSRMEMKR